MDLYLRVYMLEWVNSIQGSNYSSITQLILYCPSEFEANTKKTLPESDIYSYKINTLKVKKQHENFRFLHFRTQMVHSRIEIPLERQTCQQHPNGLTLVMQNWEIRFDLLQIKYISIRIQFVENNKIAHIF
jgi:hypothetical protein